MSLNQGWKRRLIFLVFFTQSLTAFAEGISDPCSGASPLLNLIDRPTAGDSACAVPYKKAIIEMGYQYQTLTHSAGHEQNFPEAELRIGLPLNNELVMLLPNYIHQSKTHYSGFSATVIGIKHEIVYNKKLVWAVEALFTQPNGSAAFGSKGTGAAINGIVSYNVNPSFNLTFMFGGTTETQSSHDGSQRYNSINPDLVLTFSATNKLEFYGEVYGQSKTEPREGSGFNFDAGFLYLLIPSLAVDLEVGQRISGHLVGFDHYFGTGFGILF
jgi:hypothetical protein